MKMLPFEDLSRLWLILISLIAISYFKGQVRACGGILTSLTGSFTSPNYPNNYPDSANCEWQINQGTNIHLKFEDFDVESVDTCEYDSVQVIDQGTVLGPFCGTVAPADIISTTGNLVVKFTTDSSDVYKGFKAHYTALPAATLEKQSSYPCVTMPYLGVTSDSDLTTCLPLGSHVSTTNAVLTLKYDVTCNGGMDLYLGIKNIAKCDTRTVQALIPIDGATDGFLGDFKICDLIGEIQTSVGIPQCHFSCTCDSPKNIYVRLNRKLTVSPEFDTWEFCDIFPEI